MSDFDGLAPDAAAAPVAAASGVGPTEADSAASVGPPAESAPLTGTERAWQAYDAAHPRCETFGEAVDAWNARRAANAAATAEWLAGGEFPIRGY